MKLRARAWASGSVAIVVAIACGSSEEPSGGARGDAGTDAAAGSAGTSATGGVGGLPSTGGGGGGEGGSSGSAGADASAGTGGGVVGGAGAGGQDASNDGVGGSAGASAGGSAGASAGGSAGAGGSGGQSCSGNQDCESDELCSKATCASATGVCAPKPASCSSIGAYVCGCDGVVYWNDCLRQKTGIASSTGSAACGLNAARCGGAQNLQCPTPGAVCGELFGQELDCSATQFPGACWMLPDECPQIAVGTRWRSCNGGLACFDDCGALEAGGRYYYDAACPQ